jgi:phosphohistidine phosphatase
MKELIIARHAKSSWKNNDLSDIERPLNSRGYSNANSMGQFLINKQSKPDLIYTSPAIRAFSTATIYARYLEFNYNNFSVLNELYFGSIQDIEKQLKQTSSQKNVVMIFGHNPTFTELANYYTYADIDNIPTAGIVSVIFDIDNWIEIERGKGKMNFFQYPKKLIS